MGSVEDENVIDKVNKIISNSALELKSVKVDKPIELGIDLGTLVAEDNNELEKEKIFNKSEQQSYLTEIARDAAQDLLNKVFSLKTTVIDNYKYVELPKPSISIPREKPVPIPKPLTKWELYAKEKGIQKKKKVSQVWDEVLAKWIPRFGYQKVQAEKDKNWLIEVPANADPYEDQFAKRAKDKSERVAKNELLRLQNIARAKNIKLPKMGVTTENLTERTGMQKALALTRKSTASLGKFQKDLEKEKYVKPLKGQKRKLPANDLSQNGLKQDQEASLQVLKKINKGELDLESAVNKQIKMENYETSQKGRTKSGRRSKMGVRKRGNSEYKKNARSKDGPGGKGASSKRKPSNFSATAGKKKASKPKAPDSIKKRKRSEKNKS